MGAGRGIQGVLPCSWKGVPRCGRPRILPCPPLQASAQTATCTARRQSWTHCPAGRAPAASGRAEPAGIGARCADVASSRIGRVRRGVLAPLVHPSSGPTCGLLGSTDSAPKKPSRVLTMTTRLAMSVAMLGADIGSVRSASAAISVRATMFFFSTVVSSVSAWANATTRPDWAAIEPAPAGMGQSRCHIGSGGRRRGQEQRSRVGWEALGLPLE